MGAMANNPVRMKEGLQHQPGFQRVLYRDAIAKFIEKIAPKVSLQKNRVRKVAEIFSYRLGSKRVTKIVYA
jgi:hypothetical protein